MVAPPLRDVCSRATCMADMPLLRPPPRSLLKRGPPPSVRKALASFEMKIGDSVAAAEALAAAFWFPAAGLSAVPMPALGRKLKSLKDLFREGGPEGRGLLREDDRRQCGRGGDLGCRVWFPAVGLSVMPIPSRGRKRKSLKDLFREGKRLSLLRDHCRPETNVAINNSKEHGRRRSPSSSPAAASSVVTSIMAAITAAVTMVVVTTIIVLPLITIHVVDTVVVIRVDNIVVHHRATACLRVQLRSSSYSCSPH